MAFYLSRWISINYLISTYLWFYFKHSYILIRYHNCMNKYNLLSFFNFPYKNLNQNWLQIYQYNYLSLYLSFYLSLYLSLSLSRFLSPLSLSPLSLSLSLSHLSLSPSPSLSLSPLSLYLSHYYLKIQNLKSTILMLLIMRI